MLSGSFYHFKNISKGKKILSKSKTTKIIFLIDHSINGVPYSNKKTIIKPAGGVVLLMVLLVCHFCNMYIHMSYCVLSPSREH